MSEQLFRDILRALLAESEIARDRAKAGDNDVERDMWSAVAGHLDNARQRMRK